MGRTRKSAKCAGSSFERLIADYLADELGEDVDRQVKNGANDLGDVRGVKLLGQPVVIECKEYRGQHNLPEWYREAERERDNKGACIGVVVWKRYGKGKAQDQHVSMTMAEFVRLIKLVNGGGIDGNQG